MKNLKTTILTIIIAMCCYSNSNAQEAARGKTKGKITTIGDRGLILVLGGGLSSPSSEAKDKAFLSNATAINADLFLPILKKEGASYNFGINIGGTYSFGGSAGLGTLPNPYLVSGQTSSIVSDKGGSPAQAEFRMGAGPQANFYLGKLIVSPMVLAQYMSFTQKEQSAIQTTVVGGQSYDFALASLPETKTSGFAVTPKLRLHYMFSERFGLFADASYTMGPKAETVIRKLFPNGAPNTPTNDYDLQALQTANFENGKTKSTALNSMGFNFGVVIGFGDRVNAGKTGIKIGGASEMPNSLKTAVGNNIEQIVTCGPGLYPNPGGGCYPCLGCHPCNISQYPLVNYCDNATGVMIFNANGVISSDELINQIKSSNVKISNDDKKRLLENSNTYKRKPRDICASCLQTGHNSMQCTALISSSGSGSIVKANTDDIKKGWNGLADAPDELESTTPSNARTINNCCNATVTGSIQWDVPGAGFTLVTATPSLGSYSMASISAGITFNSTINCLTYSGCIDPLPIVYKVNGVIYGTVANTTNFIIPASAFPTPGGYTITVIGKCGGVKCKAKKMQITIY